MVKMEPDKEVWYYEHPYPPGVKSYNKTKPIRIEELEPEQASWNNRQETEFAWRVPVDQIRDGGYNLDIKNPHDKSGTHAAPPPLPLPRSHAHRGGILPLRQRGKVGSNSATQRVAQSSQARMGVILPL